MRSNFLLCLSFTAALLLLQTIGGQQSSSKIFDKTSMVQQTEQGSKKKVKIIAHYIDFDMETGYAITPDRIKKPNSGERLFLTEREAKEMYRYFDHEKTEGKLNPNRTRLLVEKSPGRNEVVVDQVGGIHNGDREYVMSPLDFLRLSRLLEEIANRQAKASGKPRS